MAFPQAAFLVSRRFCTNARHIPGLLLINVITEEEEKALIAYLDPLLRRKRYEGNHWDDVITKYKELELPSSIPIHIASILDPLRALISDRYKEFGGTCSAVTFLPPHVIDLDSNGYIGPHVDSIKFSGDMIAGLSLNSLRIMVLLPDTDTGTDEIVVSSSTDEALSDVTQVIRVTRYPATSMHDIDGNSDSNSDSIDSNSDSIDSIDSNVDADIAISYMPSTKIHDMNDPHYMTDSSYMADYQYERVEFRLPPRSLYLLLGPLRYKYTHSILGKCVSVLYCMFRNVEITCHVSIYTRPFPL